MLQKLTLIIAFFFAMISLLLGQNRIGETFYNYEVLSIDSKVEKAKTQTGFFKTNFNVPERGINWELDLSISNIISDDYMVRYGEGGEIIERLGTSAVPTQGYIVGQPESRVSLTYNEGFIYGFIQSKGKYYYIEPLSHFDKAADKDKFIFYAASDLKPTAEKTCGTESKHHSHMQDHVTSERSVGQCFELEYAIASDFLMYQAYGNNVTAVENHAIGVTNNVQTNYDDEFADEIQFVIVEQFIATSSAMDPWSNTTSAGDLLDDFTNWGPGGFAATHDVGSLWTDRNFAGSTIGIAWVGVICGNSRYNCLQDFTNNPETKRVLVSHELGHNFNASHDASGSGFIMAPSVNTSTSWSDFSIGRIDNHIASRFCLSSCAPSGTAPTADFTFDQFTDCVVGEVQFFDNSSGTNLTYDWDFPGGTPSSSDQQNPIVSYPVAGIYDATLTVSNNLGSDTQTQLGIININDEPTADFLFSISGNIVSFNSFLDNTDAVFWDFGDGNTSDEQNPIHTYVDDGFYTVILFALNICGEITVEKTLEILTDPIPEFSNTDPDGCEGHIVSFINLSSSNTSFVEWNFEGGDPAISNDDNPDVTYVDAGVFDVTMIAFNDQGQTTLVREDLIEIFANPIAEFTFALQGNTINFLNLSTSATDYVWDFGDGNTSTEVDPTHSYADAGTYTVLLTATANNECGESTFSESITITLIPVAGFIAENNITDGCTPFTVKYINTSVNNATSFNWTFEGGTPATSTETDPLVTYNTTGTFDVSLIAINSEGQDEESKMDFINVETAPSASFTSETDELVVDFTSLANNASSYDWDFGDGNTSTQANPSHTYTTDGVYDVILIVSNACGDFTVTNQVAVYSAVSATFNVGTDEICPASSVQFTSSTNISTNTYSWEFEGGDPATSSVANPTVAYASPGSYDVMLTVSNPQFSDEVLMMDAVTVLGPLSPSFTNQVDALVVNFDNTTAGAASVSWDFGDGNTSTESDPSHTYEKEGIYEVILTVTDICGSYSTSETINLYTSVSAMISSSAEAGCAPLTVLFDDNSPENTTSRLWKFEGGSPATSMMETPSVTWETKGEYLVTLIVSNPVSTDSMEITVSVNDVLDASFESFREMLTVSFTNTSGAGGTGFSWDFGDGNNSTLENPTHTYSTEGDYEVSFTVTNECGPSTVIQTVTASALPSANYSVSSTEGCAPLEVTYTDESSSNATAWSWIFEGGSPATSTERNPTVTYDSKGLYDVTLTVTAPAGSDTRTTTDYITINGLPEGDFTFTQASKAVTFTSSIDDDSTYEWDFGNGTSSTDRNPNITYDADGTYDVILTITNGCGSIVIEKQVVINTVNVEDLDITFDIYPNPASEVFTVETSETAVTMEIYSTSGQLINTQSVLSGKSISTENLANGTYIIRLKNAEGDSAFKKLLIFR